LRRERNLAREVAERIWSGREFQRVGEECKKALENAAVLDRGIRSKLCSDERSNLEGL